MDILIEKYLFYFFSALSVAGGLLALTRKNPLHGGLFLIVSFLGLAGLFSLLNASLIAVMQVLVYTGAIMMLIIFTLMMINMTKEEIKKERISKVGLIASIFLGMLTFKKLVPVFFKNLGYFEPTKENFGSIETVGMELFTKHILSFELVSILLIVALIATIVIAKGEDK